jgi:hypothetical protein
MRKMGKSDDIRAAVIDDLTFDPDVDASDIRVEEGTGTWCSPEASAAMARDALTLGGAVPEGVEAAARDGDITLTGSVRTGTERKRQK